MNRIHSRFKEENVIKKASVVGAGAGILAGSAGIIAGSVCPSIATACLAFVGLAATPLTLGLLL